MRPVVCAICALTPACCHGDAHSNDNNLHDTAQHNAHVASIPGVGTCRGQGRKRCRVWFASRRFRHVIAVSQRTCTSVQRASVLAPPASPTASSHCTHPLPRSLASACASAFRLPCDSPTPPSPPFPHAPTRSLAAADVAYHALLVRTAEPVTEFIGTPVTELGCASPLLTNGSALPHYSPLTTC